MNLRVTTLGNEVIIVYMTQMMGKDIEMYVDGCCEQHSVGGMSRKSTENALYLFNKENRNFNE